MTTPEHWQAQFEAQTHRTVESVLEPIAGDCPEGENLRRDPIYREIQKGRECDDPSLPRGPWEGELKRADWRSVRERALQALTKRSKDLQLLAWVLEAQIHLVGFAGVAPAIHLIERVCAEYWDRLYPQTVDGDCDHRNNVFHAINDKLQPALRLVPLCVGEERRLCWADYVRAHRNQSLRTKGVEESQLEGPGLADCQKLILATPAEHWLEVYVELSAALASLERLRTTLAELQPEETPSLGGVVAVLTEISDFVKKELSQRGYRHEYDSELPPATPSAERGASQMPAESEPPRARSKAPSPGPSRRPGERTPSIPAPYGGGAVFDQARERARAYAQLAELADMLLRVDPHSPTPYLIKRAVAWGDLSTAQLYQELFVRCEGRLSIFELMGIHPGK